MKKKEFVELINQYADDMDIYVDGSEQFEITTSNNSNDDKFISIIKID